MRVKRFAYLAGVAVIALVAVEVFLQPIRRSPTKENIAFEFDMPASFAELLAREPGEADDFVEVAQKFVDDPSNVDKDKVGEYYVTVREADKVLLLNGDALTKAEALRHGKALESILKKKWPGTRWDRDRFKEQLKKLGDTPSAKLGPLAVYSLKPNLGYGLDLQGGVHLVLQCRRALFEYALEGDHAEDAFGGTAKERLATTRKIRGMLANDIHDLEVVLPEDKPNTIQVRTQASSDAEFASHQRAIREALTRLFPDLKERDPQKFYDKINNDKRTVDRTIEIIRSRVDKLGVSEPVIQKQGEDRVVVELAGVYDPKEAIKYIGTTALLEFRKIPERYKPRVENEGVKEVVYFEDSVSGETGDSGEVYAAAPKILTGTDLTPKTVVGVDQFGKPTTELEFTKVGRGKFGNFTRRNVGKYLGIFLDGECISAPVIKEPITGGKCVISGGFADAKEAKRLADLLNAGALPIPIDVVEERTVTATLGADSLHKSLVAGVWGVALIFLFMTAYYRLPGLLACVSLGIYGLLIGAILALISATLTLPGIVGIVISVGMAVDANIIIFERLKEELRTNKTFKSAVDAGFNRAWTAILDSQVTTLIAAAVLFVYGTGPIQGFALTLSVGTLTNLFTAITVTRLFMNVVVDTSVGRNRALYLA